MKKHLEITSSSIIEFEFDPNGEDFRKSFQIYMNDTNQHDISSYLDFLCLSIKANHYDLYKMVDRVGYFKLLDNDGFYKEPYSGIQVRVRHEKDMIAESLEVDPRFVLQNPTWDLKEKKVVQGKLF